MAEASKILARMLEHFNVFRDKCVGVQVIVSGYSDATIDSKLINHELTAAGFAKELFIESIPPSTSYLNLIRELSATGKNTRSTRSGKFKDVFPDYAVDFIKNVHDLTDKDGLRGGVGVIQHSIVKIQQDKKSARVISDSTGELARVKFTCKKVGIFQEMPEVEITVSDMAQDSDIKFLDAIRTEFSYRVKGDYTISEVIAKMNEHIKAKFLGIPLRPSGGVYFVPISQAASLIKYIFAVSVHAPIKPIIIPILNGDEFKMAREEIADNITENLMETYRRSIEKWNADLEVAEEGDKLFRQGNVLNSMIELKELQNRTNEFAEKLGFDFERVQALEQELSDLLKRAARHVSGV